MLQTAERAHSLDDRIVIPALDQARQREYTLPIFTPEGQAWKMPAGAFVTEGCGSV